MTQLEMPHVDGVSHDWIDAGGLRVHLASAGPEDGEPLLMLHGWPQHWYEWRHLVPALSERYRLLMPDLRGLGWTEVTKTGYEKENLARDQVALLDALGLERVKLIGHDWGGYAGFLLCLLAPERIERYLVTNIIHPWPKAGFGLANLWRAAYQIPMVLPLVGPRATRTPGLIKTMMRRAGKGAFSEADLDAFEGPLRTRGGALASSKYYRAFQFHDAPLLARGHWRAYRLTVPTLMVFGTGDFAIPTAALQGYEAYADDMRVEFVEGAGHFVADVRPEIVAERALEFFAER